MLISFEANIFVLKLWIFWLIRYHKRTFHPLVELEDSIQDLICLLHHTPALVHVDQPSIRKENGWPSKLPREARGNNDQAYFTNLQTDGKKDDFIKLLSKKACPRGKGGKQQSCNGHLVIFVYTFALRH